MAVEAGDNGREKASPIAYMQYMLHADEGSRRYVAG